MWQYFIADHQTEALKLDALRSSHPIQVEVPTGADADEVFDALDKGAHIYFCGLKGMMPGIQDMLKAVCEEKKIDFAEYLEGIKKKGQWHVEVY